MKKLFLGLCIGVLSCLCVNSIAAAATGYDTYEEAAGDSLKPLISNVVLDSITGTEGNANEGIDMLFDDDVTTKFCTANFPAEVIWKMDNSYVVNGIIFSTANDNSSYVGRNPETWVLSGSNDGENWTVIHEGTEEDLDDVDFMYFPVSFENTVAYTDYKLEMPNAISGCLQVAEVILCGEVPAPAEETTVAEETAAPAAEETAAAETAAAEETAAVEETVTAPQTADAVSLIAFGAIAAGAAVIASKKRK